MDAVCPFEFSDWAERVSRDAVGGNTEQDTDSVATERVAEANGRTGDAPSLEV